MAIVTLNELKEYFLTGKKPTQQQFANLIETLAAMTSANDFYSTDGTLTADRVIDGDGRDLTFYNVENLFAQVNAKGGFARVNGNRYIVFDAVDRKVFIGDYDAEGNGTMLEVSDTLQKVIVKAALGFGIKNNSGFSALLKATNLSADRDIEFQNVGGIVAYLNDVDALYSAIAALTTNSITEGATNKYFTNARALAATLSGYVSGAGVISATDTLLSAIQKLNGNLAAKIKDTAEQVFSATMTITATTAPSGGTAHYYQWSQIGRLVKMSLYLKWGTVGSGMTALLIDLPSDMPVPANITSAGATNNTLFYPGSGHSGNTGTLVGQTIWCFIVRGDGSTRAQRIQVNHASQGNNHYQLFLQYFTNE